MTFPPQHGWAITLYNDFIVSFGTLKRDAWYRAGQEKSTKNQRRYNGYKARQVVVISKEEFEQYQKLKEMKR